MIKKTLTYTDLDGNEKTEDFWFQITQAEVVKKAMVEGGEAYLEKLRGLSDLKEEDMGNGAGRKIMDTFETLLGDAVGKREGNLLVKSEEISKHFMFSGAYDAFFMELITTPDSGATFMRAMLPKDAKGAIDKAMAERGMTVEGEATDVSTPAEPTPFPQSLETAVDLTRSTNQIRADEAKSETSKDDEPSWFRENRYPSKSELMKMSPDELQFAMKMKSSKAFG